MDGKSTYGLRLDQMADLFAMGAEGPGPDPDRSDDETLRALLEEQLTCSEPKRSLLRETLVMMLDAPHRLKDRPLGDVLLSPQSDLDLLQEIKDCGKMLSGTLDSQTETALARTVYFTAIAAALVHHDTKISQNSYETLADSLALLMEKGWMAPQLVELFGQARRICLDRPQEK